MRWLAVALVPFFAVANSDTVEIKHRRPSALLGIMSQAGRAPDRVYHIAGGGGNIFPVGVTVSADDSASTVKIEGPQNLVDQAKMIIREFDVAPRRVNAHIHISSRADKYEASTETNLENNSPWTLGDAVTKTRLTVSPRINGDGTVTGSIEIQSSSGTTQLVVRARNRQLLRLTICEDGAVVMRTDDGMKGIYRNGRPLGVDAPITDPATSIEATISFEIAPDADHGRIEPKSAH